MDVVQARFRTAHWRIACLVREGGIAMEREMKGVTRDQSLALVRRFSLIDFSKIDHDRLQAILGLPEDEFVRRATAFVANDCQLMIKGPSVLVIDRSKPFDPVKFIGRDWSFWRGPAEGDGLSGDVECDDRALALTEVDFSKVRFESGHKEDESVIIGEEKLRRLVAMPEIRLDAKAGQTLFEEKGQATLRWLYDIFGITWIEFVGSVLRYPDGHRYFLYLYREDDGSWDWHDHWLGHARYRGHVSPLLAS